MWERIITMLRKEFRSIFRDPRMRLVIFGLPVVQTLIFGYAVTLDVRHVELVVIDHDQTPKNCLALWQRPAFRRRRVRATGQR